MAKISQREDEEGRGGGQGWSPVELQRVGEAGEAGRKGRARRRAVTVLGAKGLEKDRQPVVSKMAERPLTIKTVMKRPLVREVQEKDRSSNGHVQTLFPSPGLHRAVLLAHPWILGSFLKFLRRQAKHLSVSLPNQ